MYRKLTHSELVQIIWDVRDIPEFLDEMIISELKQLDLFLMDWELELHTVIVERFVDSGYKTSIWEKLENENLLHGFSMTDLRAIRNQIRRIIDPDDMQFFNYALNKLSKNFKYKAKTTKYTIIFHFLNTELKVMPITNQKYLSHIKSEYLFGTPQFNRLSFDDYTDKRYIDNLPVLRAIMNS